jgi:membrane protein YqaA with SNARE-associated domain
MKALRRALRFAVVGAIIGAVVVTVLVWQSEAHRYPAFATDGQSAMIVFFTFPVGGLTGAIVGYLIACIWGKSEDV